MKLPPLENLRIFEAVARLQGFTAAGESLGLSHSAVSRRVSELESRLNVQLMHRTSRRLALTPEGKVLLEAVQEALQRIEEATEEILRPARQRPLLVSCERSLAMRWLIPRLSQFQDAHPDLPIYLSTGNGAVDVAREHIDVAIRRADFALDPRAVCISLFTEQTGPVALPGLSGKALLTRLHSTSRPDAWKTWARRARVAARAARGAASDLHFDHFFLSLRAAEAGLGMAIAPLFMVVDSLEARTLTAPQGFVADDSRYIALMRRLPEPGSPEARFMDWLHAAVEETLSAARPYCRV
ncbi:MAG: LysR family transcriptional regulator [Herbaspirillum huttiense]|uniref:LysR family transcriptional regulator n=1 Tax=Herbaspirillum huttiense TaxID=863372 RepID=UPI001AD4A1CB|nr:LysR family transcriptional regulator [Herbaspirillum huttiense]MBN9356719.1 LysR family transcriptional regulator [Herbaspirillum huttiense]